MSNNTPNVTDLDGARADELKARLKLAKAEGRAPEIYIYDAYVSDEVRRDLRSYFSRDVCIATEGLLSELAQMGLALEEIKGYSDQENLRYIPLHWKVSLHK